MGRGGGYSPHLLHGYAIAGIAQYYGKSDPN